MDNETDNDEIIKEVSVVEVNVIKIPIWYVI